MFKILAVVSILVNGQLFEPPTSYTYTQREFATIGECEAFRKAPDFAKTVEELRKAVEARNFGAEIKVDTECKGEAAAQPH